MSYWLGRCGLVKRLAAAWGFALAALPTWGQAFLLPLGAAPPGLGAVPLLAVMSGDGETVFANFQGVDVRVAFRWRPGEGYVPVPAHPNYRGGQVMATSADGSRFSGIVMQSMSPLNQSAAVWLDGVHGPPELNSRVRLMTAMSRDGLSWGGDENEGAVYRKGVRRQIWPRFAAIQALSADGSVAGGYGEAPAGSGLGSAFVWRESVGMTFLPPVPGFTADYVYGLTADGGAALGISALRNAAGQVVDTGLWTWTAAGGRARLADPRPDLRPVWPQITGDGSVVSSIFTPRSGSGASESHLYFTASGAWVRFEDHLRHFGLSTEGWRGFRVSGISDDGLAFTGTAYYQDMHQHFYARVPGPVAMAALALAGLAAWGSRKRRAC